MALFIEALHRGCPARSRFRSSAMSAGLVVISICSRRGMLDPAAGQSEDRRREASPSIAVRPKTLASGHGVGPRSRAGKAIGVLQRSARSNSCSPRDGQVLFPWRSTPACRSSTPVDRVALPALDLGAVCRSRVSRSGKPLPRGRERRAKSTDMRSRRGCYAEDSGARFLAGDGAPAIGSRFRGGPPGFGSRPGVERAARKVEARSTIPLLAKVGLAFCAEVADEARHKKLGARFVRRA